MKSGAKKAAWIVGLVAGAAGVGTAIYYATKPKSVVPTGTPTSSPSTKTSTVVTPTATPGIFAAFSPNSNVSWVDQNGLPIGQGNSFSGELSTARLPR